jgi:hypothetical protein
MSGLPGFKFSFEVFLSGLAQFRHDAGVLRRQPIIELIKRFDRREHFFWNFHGLTWHDVILSYGRKNTIYARLWYHSEEVIRIYRIQHRSEVYRKL